MNLNGTEYYYIRNAQGDIIGLFDKTGNQVVSYTYDTWGKLMAIDGSLKDSVGVKNLYRYRGYRYDAETGLYYLNARYYNAEWGRFINMDGIAAVTGDLLSSNMFVYCLNNPVNMQDSNGYRPEFSGTGHDYAADIELALCYMSSVNMQRNINKTKTSGRVEAASLPNTNLSGAAWGTAAGVVENIKKEVRDYVGADSVIHLNPSTSIAQRIQPFAGKAKFTAKAFTVVTGAFDISHTWDPHVELSLGERVGKTALQAAGIGIGIAVGAFLSGPLLAAGMASGGFIAIGSVMVQVQ